MFNSIDPNTNLRKVVKRCIILSVLLPAASLFAQTQSTQADNSMKADHKAATPRVVYSSKSITRGGTTFRKASSVDLSSTKKVTKDDFGRLPLTVRQPRDTRMIWLGQQNRATRPSTPKTTWLGRKKGSD
jgi:hypothetical protein